ATQFVMLCVAFAHLASQYGKNTTSRGRALNFAPQRGQVSGAVRVVTGRGFGASMLSRLRIACFDNGTQAIVYRPRGLRYDRSPRFTRGATPPGIRPSLAEAPPYKGVN